MMIEESIDILRESIPKRLNSEILIRNYASKALEYSEKSDFKNAAYYYKKIYYLDNQDMNNLYLLANVLFDWGNYQESLDYLSLILEYDQASARVFKLTARCLEKLGDYETSELYYQKYREYC